MDLGHDNLVKRQLYREVSETMPIEALEDRYGHLFPSEDSAIVRSACRDVQTFAGHASLPSHDLARALLILPLFDLLPTAGTLCEQRPLSHVPSM